MTMALIWERFITSDDRNGQSNFRAKVPGGWFVRCDEGGGTAFFYPDPEHEWDGNSLP